MEPAVALLILIGLVGAALLGFFVARTMNSRRVELLPSAAPLPTAEVDGLRPLYPLPTHLVEITETRSLLQAAAESIHDVRSFPLITVYPYDPATNELFDPIVVGADSVPGLAHRLRIGATIYGEVAHSRKSYLVEELKRERRFGVTLEGMHSAYVIPLVHGTHLLGVFAVQSNKVDAFPEAERESLDRLAVFVSGLAATTVRISDYQQAIRRFDRFQLLAQSLTEVLDSRELLQEIVGTAREMLDAQMSVLLNVDEETGDLHPIAWSGISDEVAGLMRSRYKEDLKGLVGWARRPARTADLRTDQRTALATHAVVAGMLSELAVPVLYSDKLYGVLAVETNVHRYFTDEETNLLSAMAATAGIALRNAQLFENTQEANRALEKTVADLVISQQQAENARLAAVEANKLKTEFVNNMSHELRTPLNAVINFTRIVLDGHAGPVTDQQKEFLDHVHDSGQHLLGLINDILDLAKIEAGKMQLRREMTPIEPILRGVMSTAVGLTRDKGLALKTEIAPELPALDIDGVRIRQVLLNLLSNAAKFTPSGGITMRALVKDHSVLITVEDTGIGISTEDIPKVFEEFRQIDGSLQRIETGTGLGMPISRRFVELHGGKMWLESAPGKGTTVSFTLPITVPIIAAPVEAPMA